MNFHELMSHCWGPSGVLNNHKCKSWTSDIENQSQVFIVPWRRTSERSSKIWETLNNVLIVFKFLSDQIQRFNHKSLWTLIAQTSMYCIVLHSLPIVVLYYIVLNVLQCIALYWIVLHYIASMYFITCIVMHCMYCIVMHRIAFYHHCPLDV